MNTLAMLAVLTVLFTSGLVVFARSFIARPEPLTSVQARLASTGPAATAPTTAAGFDLRVGEMIRDRLAGFGRTESFVLKQNLRITATKPEKHAYERLLTAVMLMAIPPINTILLSLLGIGLPMGLVIIVSLGLAVVGAFLPDKNLQAEADNRRVEMRYGLSVFLDLVVMLMAGGSGSSEAVRVASASGEGWVFAEFQSAIRRADLRAIQPWDELSALGAELGVTELVEVAASLTLGGSHGAVQIDSLTSRADALRSTLASVTEARAEERSERMLMPLNLLLAAFVIFAAFGALRSSGTNLTDNQPTQPGQNPSVLIAQTN